MCGENKGKQKRNEEMPMVAIGNQITQHRAISVGLIEIQLVCSLGIIL